MVDKIPLQDIPSTLDAIHGTSSSAVKHYYTGEDAFSFSSTDNPLGSGEVRNEEKGPPNRDEEEIVPSAPLPNAETASQVESGRPPNSPQTPRGRWSLFRGRSEPVLSRRTGEAPSGIERSWSVLSWKKNGDRSKGGEHRPPGELSDRTYVQLRGNKKKEADGSEPKQLLIDQYRFNYEEAKEIFINAHKMLYDDYKSYSRYSAPNLQTLGENINQRARFNGFTHPEQFSQKVSDVRLTIGQKEQEIRKAVEGLITWSKTHRSLEIFGHIYTAKDYQKKVEKMITKLVSLDNRYQKAGSEIDTLHELYNPPPSFEIVANETYVSVQDNGILMRIQQLPPYSVPASNEESSNRANKPATLDRVNK